MVGTSNKVLKPTRQEDDKFAKKSGVLLEKLDNKILEINQLKAAATKETPEPESTTKDEFNSDGEEMEPSEAIDWDDKISVLQNVDPNAFRQYELACDRVKLFYIEQHEKQTVAYNIQARINFKTKTRAKMSVWEGLEKLNKLLDDSDPDTELSQIDHALQTAEAIRRDKKPRWFQLVGLIHDLGKLLYFFDSQGQWDVVGDTFPVGCKFLKKIIFAETFKKNSDFFNPLYNTKYGIYYKNCGLDKVMLSWGHDEYMYHVAKRNSKLPPEALAMIRYHSFYPWHKENAYQYLMNEDDKKMLSAVRAFNKYDLYSKSDDQPLLDVKELKGYYLDLIDEYFPTKIIEF
ncbi:uncharacterized protein KQ657_003477 [Scheffersomyces spartinae]|uniref:Inositol oxygenase n=1 Tax=Scheffersomyces spartinae TaxID=45513 RepID=A0A9P7V5A8_9ASCO|nr:uncharacterized protein KQ657_003477 [Scheffersomyces spartinae]KAG7191431.1 hypothetical protein KQ657_003477 [Scheffersomyces spartinae]